MIGVDKCSGCRNDYYNQPGNALDGKRCWSAQKGEMATRYRIGTWTEPTAKGAFTEVTVPNCYRATGVAFYEKLPDFVKASDLSRTKRSA